MTRDTLLALLQLGDGLFPAGGFAHSFGLETYAQEGRVRDRVGLEAFVTASTGSAAASMTTYQSVATCRMSPGVRVLPVGSASASMRPACVVTRRRPQRRSSAVSTSASRSRRERSAS